MVYTCENVEWLAFLSSLLLTDWIAEWLLRIAKERSILYWRNCGDGPGACHLVPLALTHVASGALPRVGHWCVAPEFWCRVDFIPWRGGPTESPSLFIALDGGTPRPTRSKDVAEEKRSNSSSLRYTGLNADTSCLGWTPHKGPENPLLWSRSACISIIKVRRWRKKLLCGVANDAWQWYTRICVPGNHLAGLNAKITEPCIPSCQP